MNVITHRSASHSLLRAAIAALTLTAAACGTGDKKSDTAAMAPSPAPAAMPATDTLAGTHTDGNMGAMGQMKNMTGDPDRDFLRMMSDHHKGLILLAHMTKDRKEGGSAVGDAEKLDAAQDKEIDQMQTMLEKDFKDPYAPKVSPENQAMADELKTKTGKEYDRTFYQDIIKHHQGALKMVDEYLPKSKNATIKQMAEKMKADQTKEIAEFQKKVDKLK